MQRRQERSSPATCRPWRSTWGDPSSAGTARSCDALPPLRPFPLGAVLFYAGAPVAAVTWAAMRQNCAIVCKSPYEGLGVGLVRALFPRRVRPRLKIQVHGDWHAASTMYGSPVRRWWRLCPTGPRNGLCVGPTACGW